VEKQNMTEITPGQVSALLTEKASAEFVTIETVTPPSKLNMTNGVRGNAGINRKKIGLHPVVCHGTFHGTINGNWLNMVNAARAEVGLPPLESLGERKNGLAPMEERPASTLVTHERNGHMYVRLMRRSIIQNGKLVGCKLNGTYRLGENGREIEPEELAPFWSQSGLPKLEQAKIDQGDPGTPVLRPGDYYDLRLDRIRVIRCKSDTWVVKDPKVEFPPPPVMTEAPTVEKATVKASAKTK
jgi:hypothetical protein